MKHFDAIFIGSGHNALIAAAYLARSGWSVLMLEKNDRPGGLVRTEELTLPGFRHDVYAGAHPFFVTSPAYADLGEELAARGLSYVNTDQPTGVSMPSGKTAVFFRDLEANIEEADRLAPGDGGAFRQMMEELGAQAADVSPLFGLDLTSAEAAPYLRRLMLNAAGTGPSAFASELLLPARDVLEARFRSRAFHALVAPWVLQLGRTPDGANSGFWVPMILASLMAGGMATAVGGSGKLADALVRLIEDHGGLIFTGTGVEQILVRDGRAVGVRTEEGEDFAADAVVASVNPDQLYLRLLVEADLQAPLRREAARYRYGRGCVQIHLALSEAPRFADGRLDRTGLVHLTPGLLGVSMQVQEARSGLLPKNPTIAFDSPTVLDPSRAPGGNATVRLQILEVPCRPRGDAADSIAVGDGTWTEDLKRRFADRVIGIASRHVPNLPGAILGCHVVSPDDLSRFSPNQGPGDPYGGSHDLSQSYFFRPLPSQPSHRTAVPNVYMLGAATWPGHGVNGGSGYIVAQQLLRQGRPTHSRATFDMELACPQS
ncbi:MAG TPA: NAD(P)/FAD-dependent oxidoreductase [Thermoanaerobaculia bacterium]|nr:NAD(P)/FAD-dependent oxidoreductase [Thermoanaerobaculia bacterium]